MDTLSVSEIYRSLQGEGTRAGRPCVIVRLAGCNLRCTWCDTKHAYDDGADMSPQAVLEQVRQMDTRMVMVTGGEPLLQAPVRELLRRLCESGHETVLMTNGSQDIRGLDERVIRCVDVKGPSSGQSESVLWSNLDDLRRTDEVKFVIADRADFEFARQKIRQHGLTDKCVVILSVAWGLLEPAQLAAWMLEERLDARLGLQLHKIIWPRVARGV